ncbi:MAG: OmpA family protein [Parasphingorhabdus sp.]|nr:OmpA family protein [Parasphingorhabdus sp.]
MADLSLLLLAMMALLMMTGGTALRKASVIAQFSLADTFLPDDARLTDTGKASLGKAVKLVATGTANVTIEIAAQSGATTRLDSWDMASARASAIARFLISAGIMPSRIRINVMRGDTGQLILKSG